MIENPIYKHGAYGTLATNGVNLDKIHTSIEKYNVWKEKDGVGIAGYDYPEVSAVLTDDAAQSSEVNAFAHPIYVKEKWWFDARPFTKFDMRNLQTIVSNLNEFKFNFDRTKLCRIFSDAVGINYLRDISDLPMTVYASWISENVGRRFSLDHGAQYRLMLLSAIQYYGYFHLGPLDDDLKNRAAIRISRALRASAQDVLGILDEMEEFGNITEFCRLVREVVGSVRLQNFDVGLLFTILGGTWLGYNAREIACVALEHPPTFISMVNMACNERGFSASPFSKLVQRKGKKEAGEFSTKLNNIYLSFQ